MGRIARLPVGSRSAEVRPNVPRRSWIKSLDSARGKPCVGKTRCEWPCRHFGGSRTDENGVGFGYHLLYAAHGSYAEDCLVLRARLSMWRGASREPELVARRLQSTEHVEQIAPLPRCHLVRGVLGRPRGRPRRLGPPKCDGLDLLKIRDRFRPASHIYLYATIRKAAPHVSKVRASSGDGDPSIFRADQQQLSRFWDRKMN